MKRLMLNDGMIRAAMKTDLLLEHVEDPSTLIVEELGLKHGRVRVDIAVVNGALHAYEIKSDRDSLSRLPDQVAVYGSVADYATVVTGSRHREKIAACLPAWWGLEVAELNLSAAISFNSVRQARPNPHVDPLGVARLLWREEALALLTDLDCTRGLRRKPRAELYALLAEKVPLETLRSKVRECLKKRRGWRSARPRVSSDGSSPPAAK